MKITMKGKGPLGFVIVVGLLMLGVLVFVAVLKNQENAPLTGWIPRAEYAIEEAITVVSGGCPPYLRYVTHDVVDKRDICSCGIIIRNNIFYKSAAQWLQEN